MFLASFCTFIHINGPGPGTFSYAARRALLAMRLLMCSCLAGRAKNKTLGNGSSNLFLAKLLILFWECTDYRVPSNFRARACGCEPVLGVSIIATQRWCHQKLSIMTAQSAPCWIHRWSTLTAIIYTHCCHQTWQLEILNQKSGSFQGRIIELNGGFSIAMFDWRRYLLDIGFAITIWLFNIAMENPL